MQNSETVVPGLLGALVTILLEVNDEWRILKTWIKSLISGFISFCCAYYLVPAVLLFLELRYPHYKDILSNPSVISLAGFVGGIFGGKIVKVAIFLFDRYSKKFVTKFLDKKIKDEPEGD